MDSKRMSGAVAALLLLAGAGVAQAQSVQLSVGGQIAPGVYGRVDVGNAPPPPVLYTQPVIVTPAPVAVAPAPIYLHVPPGQVKKWSKYCRRYAACGVPVYFVRGPEYGPDWDKPHKHGHDDHGKRGRGKHDHDDRR